VLLADPTTVCMTHRMDVLYNTQRGIARLFCMCRFTGLRCTMMMHIRDRGDGTTTAVSKCWLVLEESKTATTAATMTTTLLVLMPDSRTGTPLDELGSTKTNDSKALKHHQSNVLIPL